MPSNRIIDIKRVESGSEPVTLTEAKARLIITSTDDDTLITSIITSARQQVENYCHISIIAKTITFIADLFKEWELPYGPVTGILSVQKRVGNEGSGPATYETVTTGWSSEGDSFLHFNPSPVSSTSDNIFLQHDLERWPSDLANRWKIIYTAGYTIVPQDLKEAILAQVVHDYENRGEINTEKQGLCFEAENRARQYRRELWF